MKFSRLVLILPVQIVSYMYETLVDNVDWFADIRCSSVIAEIPTVIIMLNLACLLWIFL